MRKPRLPKDWKWSGNTATSRMSPGKGGLTKVYIDGHLGKNELVIDPATGYVASAPMRVIECVYELHRLRNCNAS